MLITSKEYKKINNAKELKKSKSNLKKWFNLFIRLRGFNKVKSTGTIEGKCIACGKKLILEKFSDGSVMNGRNFHASHFYDADKYAGLEFYEDNVWLSCNRCNSPNGLHGNKTEYLPNLLKEIGGERFGKMGILAHQIYKADILTIDRMVFEYRDKAKAEAVRLGLKV